MEGEVDKKIKRRYFVRFCKKLYARHSGEEEFYFNRELYYDYVTFVNHKKSPEYAFSHNQFFKEFGLFKDCFRTCKRKSEDSRNSRNDKQLFCGKKIKFDHKFVVKLVEAEKTEEVCSTF